MPTIRERCIFAQEALRDGNVASLVPTSASAVITILRGMPTAPGTLTIEYGPGIGVFGEEIIRTLRGRLALIERNPRFAELLKKKFKHCPNVDVYHDDACNVEAIAARYKQKATTVLSGIPFSLFPDGVKFEIMEATKKVLLPGYPFRIYQFRDRVGPYLKKVFDHVKTGYVWHNLFPPLYTYKAFDCGCCALPPHEARPTPAIPLHADILYDAGG